MRSLQSTYLRFSAELDDLLETFEGCPPLSGRDAARLGGHRVAREGAVLQCLDAWGRFVRASVLVSAWEPGPGTRRRSHGEALAELARNKNRIQHFSHGEPSWHLQGSAIDAIHVLGLRAAAQMVSAIGASTVTSPVGEMANPLSELHVVRNYVAHRGPFAGQSCYAIVRQSGARSVLEWLDAPLAGVPRFRVLVENVRTLAQASIR